MLFKKNQKIVFAGDSVTDDDRMRPHGEGSCSSNALGNGYVRMVNTALTVDHPELNLRIINTGISGDTSADLLKRWDSDITALAPDWVILCIGFNDVWRQFDYPEDPSASVLPEKYRSNLNAMAEKTNCNMIWMTPYYFEPNVDDAMRKRMDEYGAIMKEEAAKRNILCMDLQEAFTEILKHRYPAYISWDRVHPGWIGSFIIARAILKEIGYKSKL